MSTQYSEKSPDSSSAAGVAPAPARRTPRSVAWLAQVVMLACVVLYVLTARPSAWVSQPSTSPAQTRLRIGTYNIRYDGRASQPVPLPAERPAWTGAPSRGTKWGEQPWAERRWAVADQVIWEDLDLVGFQEVLANQLDDLKALMGQEYAWEGVGEYMRRARRRNWPRRHAAGLTRSACRTRRREDGWRVCADRVQEVSWRSCAERFPS